jgi:hypothetical protein
MTDTTKVVGTFACPICGQDTLHHHSPEVVEAYRSDQVRRDGWISTLVRLPTNEFPRFYLARGHEVVRPEDDWHNVSYVQYQRVQAYDIKKHGEVLEWDPLQQRFLLLYWSGNARVSGEEGRRPVYVTPTHWRPLPVFGQPNDAERMAGCIAGLQAVVKDQRDRLLSMQVNHEYERERLVRELGEARGASGVRMVGHACKLDGSICESRPDRCSDCPAGGKP